MGRRTSTHTEAAFSNYGTCVDFLAPGVGIMSSNYAITSGLASRSGTSMAAPHVAGVAALILQGSPTSSPASVWRNIYGNSVTNTISLRRTSIYYGTPNRFVFTDW